MNYKLISVLSSFVAGVTLGSVVTWRLLKTKYDKEYEKKYQEEVKEAKEFYKKTKTTTDNVNHEEPQVVTNSNIANHKLNVLEYAAKIKELNYANNETDTFEGLNKRKEDDSTEDEIYVISEEEYDNAGYDTETLTYYADGVLTDWFNEVVDEPISLVGFGTLEHYDEYAEGDTLYVRNENHMTDYEIARDYRNYYDVFPMNQDYTDD